MRRRTDRIRRARGRVAAIGIGALLAAASVVPATAAQAAATTTVHGTVQSGSTRLTGVPVGFWSRTGHTLATTTSGVGGAFTLHVPSGVRGFAYAGVRPDATKAIFAVGGRSFVRGVIGAGQGATTSYRIHQGHASATAAGLAGGSALHFRLQKPGRVTVQGGHYFAGTGDDVGLFQILRLDGSLVTEASARGAAGVATSKLVVPGTYKLHYFPQAPYLRRTVPVTVPAGATKTVAPTFVAGATVSGTLKGTDGKPAAGVRVAAVTGSTSGGDITDANGHYSIGTLAAGTYRLRIGYNPQPDPEDLPDDPDTILPATSDDWRTRSVGFTVAKTHAPVTENVTLAKAGHVRGTVTGAPAPVRMWLETTTGHVVRTGSVTGGEYELGGLTPGAHYRLYALAASNGTADARYGEVDVTATAGTVTRSIALTKRTLTLSGHVTGGSALDVIVKADSGVLPPLRRSFHSDSGSSTYAVHGLIPGRYTVTVYGKDRALSARPKALTLTTASQAVDYPIGPKAGNYTVRFVSGAATIPNIAVDAKAANGDDAFITTNGPKGPAIAVGLYAGTYRYIASSFHRSGGPYDVPTVDGPWWFGGISSTFTITSGHTTNDGTIALHVHATL